MRILLIVVYYPPSATSAARMMRELAGEYVRQGHHVTVVTPSAMISSAMAVDNEDGISVLRVHTGDLRASNRGMRMWRESRLSTTIWETAQSFFRANPCDLIVFYSPTIFFGELVERLKTLWNCPAYLILRDIFPKWAVDAGVLRKGMLYRYLRRKELEQYAVADAIGIEAPGDLTYFREDPALAGKQVEVLYNWLDMNARPADGSRWRSKLALDGKVVFFYGGNIGVAQDLDNLVRLAENLRDRQDIFFLLMGAGSEVKRLTAEIERRSLKNLRLHPALPQDEYMQCLSEFDVGLVSLDRRLQSNNFTGKLLGYVLCGKPVLASVSPGHDLITLLQQSCAGYACANGDDEALRTSALVLASSAQIRQRMGENARILGHRMFSVSSIARQVVSHFEPGIEAQQIAARRSS